MSTHTQEYRADALLGVNARMLSAQPTSTLLWTLAAVAAALCLRIGAGIRIVWWRYTARNDLRELDARMLNDLGLTKEAVGAETRKWFWQG